jgi:hypothetical protein
MNARKWIACFVCLLMGLAVASARTPSEHLLDAIRLVESSGGLFVRGDNGLALGDFQIHRAAWEDVNQWRKGRGIKTFNYDRTALAPDVNRAYAADYIRILHEQLRERLRRDPTGAELYAAYNLGLSGFGQKCGFRVNRVNAVTASKCRQINAYLQARP